MGTSTQPRLAGIALALLVAHFVTPAAAEAISAGSGKIVIETHAGPLDVFTYKSPAHTDGPLLVVCHGMARNADEYRDKACGLADRLRAAMATPYFDEARFSSEAYQQGGVFKAGQLQPSEQWTVTIVDKMAKAIRAGEQRPNLPYYLIGHSAGAQFLGRLAAFCTTDARRIVLANAGSYVFPTRDVPFPYGLGGLPDTLGGDEAIARYLAQPVTLYLGTADLSNADLPSGPQAMRQGATRYERGKNLFRSAGDLARDRGWKFNWRLVEADGIAHDAKAMFDHPNATRALLGE